MHTEMQQVIVIYTYKYLNSIHIYKHTSETHGDALGCAARHCRRTQMQRVCKQALPTSSTSRVYAYIQFFLV